MEGSFELSVHLIHLKFTSSVIIMDVFYSFSIVTMKNCSGPDEMR